MRFHRPAFALVPLNFDSHRTTALRPASFCNRYHLSPVIRSWLYGAYVPEAINTYIHSFSKMVQVDPSTIVQFTGLRDKNGSMVFEGDIVTYSTAPGRIFEIIWDEFMWRVKPPGTWANFWRRTITFMLRLSATSTTRRNFWRIHNERDSFQSEERLRGEWVTGYYCRAFRWMGDKDPQPAIQEADCFAFRTIIPDTLGQYTGLRDKNGEHIFEGDIVRWTWEKQRIIGFQSCQYNGHYSGTLLVVRWTPAGFMLCPIHDSMPDAPSANAKVDNYMFWNHQGGLEIAGNIYDNPELLEGAT